MASCIRQGVGKSKLYRYKLALKVNKYFPMYLFFQNGRIISEPKLEIQLQLMSSFVLLITF